MLNPVPGRTATELARDAGAAVPDLAGELTQAAIAFNDVTYGERPGTETGIPDDRRPRQPSPIPRSGSKAVTSTAPAPPDTWTAVR